jgi:hypothetical protein
MVALVAVAAADTTTTTGTGAVTLSGTATVATFNGIPATTFNTAFTNGGTVAFPIANVGYQISDGTNVEIGLGTLTSATNLTRDAIMFSTNQGRHVNFIAGTKAVTSITTQWNGSEPNWTSVPSSVLPENDVQSGTFIGALTNGGAATNVTVRFKISGAGEVTLSFPSGATNASAGTTSVMTGVPASISQTARVGILPVISNSVTVLGLATLAPGASPTATGTITFSQSTGVSPIAFSGTFTTSVANGVSQTDWTYSTY